MHYVDTAIGICSVCGAVTQIPMQLAEKMGIAENTAGHCALVYLTDTGPETCRGEVQFWGYLNLHFPKDNSSKKT